MFLKGFLYFEREVRLVPFFSNSRRAVLALRNHAEIDTAVAAAVLPSRMVGDIMRPALANAHAPRRVSVEKEHCFVKTPLVFGHFVWSCKTRTLILAHDGRGSARHAHGNWRGNA